MRSIQRMKLNNTIIGRQALFGMLNGIKVVAEAIKPSYGGAGCNTLIEREIYPTHELTNDAQAIIQAIEVTDPLEKRGLMLAKELSDRANRESGNGRKTTFLLASAILQKGYDANLNGEELKKELYSHIPFIEKYIDEHKEVIGLEDIERVATTASQDKEIGKLLAQIYSEIGKDGVIHAEGSGTYETSYKVTDGIKFGNGTGMISPYMVHDDLAKKEKRTETQAIYENPLILVTKRKITKESEIDPLLQIAKQKEKDLIIFTDDMDSTIAKMLVDLHTSKIMNICIVKPSVLWKNFIFEDFARCVGATIVEDSTGVDFKNLGISHLGTCDKIIIDNAETDENAEVVIRGGADISEHIARLKQKGDNDSLLRVMWLSTKTAVIKLGAGSEAELSQKRAKTQDAINSCRLALEDGIVKGGGLALSEIPIDNPILKETLQVPLQQNLLNMGLEKPNWGKEVVDSAKVIKNAIKIAIRLAGIVLTTGVVITLPEESFEDKQLRLLAGKRTPF